MGDNAEVRPPAEIQKELEQCQNALANLRLEAQGPGPALTTKKRTKMKTLAMREKELEAELKKSKRVIELKQLGDDLRKAATKDDLAKVAEICALPDAKRCVDSTNFEGTTSLIKAAIYDRLEMVNLLIKAGASLDLGDHLGRTALCLAAANGSMLVTKRLLELGASVTHRAENGWSVLMYAAEGGHADVCKLLIDGAHVTKAALLTKTNDAKTAVDLAIESTSKGTAAVVDYLKPLSEEAAKGAAAGPGTEGWSQLRRLSRVSMAADAFQTQGALETLQAEHAAGQRKKGSFFQRMISGEAAALDRGLSWLKGVAHDIGESFRDSFRRSATRGRDSFASSFKRSFTRRSKERSQEGSSSVLNSLRDSDARDAAITQAV